MIARNEKRRRIPHIISGIIIILHAYERYEEGHNNFFIFLIAGLIFLSVAIFHHSLVHKFPNIDFVFYAIEGLLAFIVAYEFIDKGEKLIPALYIVAGLLHLIVIIYLFYKKGKIPK